MIETRQGKLSRLKAMIRLGRYEITDKAVDAVVARLTRILLWDRTHNKPHRTRCQ